MKRSPLAHAGSPRSSCVHSTRAVLSRARPLSRRPVTEWRGSRRVRSPSAAVRPSRSAPLCYPTRGFNQSSPLCPRAAPRHVSRTPGRAVAQLKSRCDVRRGSQASTNSSGSPATRGVAIRRVRCANCSGRCASLATRRRRHSTDANPPKLPPPPSPLLSSQLSPRRENGTFNDVFQARNRVCVESTVFSDRMVS